MTLIQPWKGPNRPKGTCKALPVGMEIIFIIQSAASKVSAWKSPSLPRIIPRNSHLQKERHWEPAVCGGFSTSQAWFLAVRRKQVKRSRNPVTRAVADIYALGGFSHIFPLPLPGRWMEKGFRLVESQPRGLQSLPLITSFMPQQPSDWNWPRTSLTAVAALVWLGEGLPAVPASTAARRDRATMLWPRGYLHPETWADSNLETPRKQLKAFRLR